MGAAVDKPRPQQPQIRRVVKAFISYRRSDSAAHSGRLADEIGRRFGAEAVFVDVAALAPGSDFVAEINRGIATCSVALVVIGNQWLSATADDGSRRLDDPADHVRAEVAQSLNTDVPVVPVLVGGARLPTADELPEPLRQLAQRHAVELRDEMWHDDVGRLLEQLDRGTDPGPAEGSTRPNRQIGLTRVLIAVGIIAIALAAAVFLGGGGDTSDDTSSDDGLAPCGILDGWTELSVAPATATEEDGARYRLDAAYFRIDEGAEFGYRFDVGVSNESSADAGRTPLWFDHNDFNELHVDGFSQGDPTCFSLIKGGQNLTAGQQATGRIGFEGSGDPRGGIDIAIDTDGTDLETRSADS